MILKDLCLVFAVKNNKKLKGIEDCIDFSHPKTDVEKWLKKVTEYQIRLRYGDCEIDLASAKWYPQSTYVLRYLEDDDLGEAQVRYNVHTDDEYDEAMSKYPFQEYLCGVTGLTCCGCSLYCGSRKEKCE